MQTEIDANVSLCDCEKNHKVTFFTQMRWMASKGMFYDGVTQRRLRDILIADVFHD